MRNNPLPYSLLALSLFLLFACGTESSDQQEGEPITIESIDSNMMTTEEPAHFVNPDLIGNWKQTDMRMDGKSYAASLESTTVSFAENGEITYLSEGLPPRKGEFMQVKKILSAPEIWEADLNIKELNATKLILSEEVSGQIVEYHYQRL
ncbi:MAG: hypothetical protein AAFQ68_11820 [Bacteroidota bacterium]